MAPEVNYEPPPSIKHVVLVACERYAWPLAGVLHSLSADVSHSHSQESSRITVWVLDAGLRDETADMLQKLCPFRRVPSDLPCNAEELVWRAMPVQCLEGVISQVQHSSAAGQSYALHGALPKLQLCRMLLKEVQLPADAQVKVLYLDCDILICRSVCALFDTELAGQPLAAVVDFGFPAGHDGFPASHWDMKTDRYFNSGMMLLDLQAAAPLFEEALRWATRQVPLPEGCLLYFNDQDLLNLVFRSNWKELPLKWNAQGIGSYAKHRCQAEGLQPALFSAAQLAELQRSPCMVHFTGPVVPSIHQLLNPHLSYDCKPWSPFCRHPFAAAWRHHLRQCTRRLHPAQPEQAGRGSQGVPAPAQGQHSCSESCSGTCLLAFQQGTVQAPQLVDSFTGTQADPFMLPPTELLQLLAARAAEDVVTYCQTAGKHLQPWDQTELLTNIVHALTKPDA